MQNINRDLAAADSLFRNVSGKSSVLSRIPSASSMLAAPDLGFSPASEPVKRVLTIIGLVMLLIVGVLIMLYLVNSFFPFTAF